MSMTQRGFILRSRLIHTLDRLLDEKVIYVTAPAGYGKTTAVRQWAESRNAAKVFITLDEQHNSAASFCRHFCSALSACQPKNEELAQIISHPAFISAPEVFATRAVAALGGRRQTILVVDDVHFLHNEKVLHLMLVLLKRLPETFRIVLIGRGDLPAMFSEFWVKGSLARVTAEQLRFSEEEVEQLYRKRGNQITPKAAREISRLTGGWAMGICALLLAGGEPVGEHALFQDEIMPGVWDMWDEAAQSFMLSTALARELTPSLCNALAGIEHSEAMLRSLVRKGAFISQTKEGAYRYHRLFQAYLRSLLEARGEAAVHEQHRKEGRWHLERKDFYSALECFVMCRDVQGLAQCFSLLVDSGHEYFIIEKLITVAHVTFVDEVARHFPYIYSILSWAAFNEGRADDMTRYADLYYANQAEIKRLDPRLQLNVVLVRLIDFRYSLGSLTQMSGELLEGLGKNGLRENGVSIGTINQNMPLLHRGTRDFSECAAMDVEESVRALRQTLGGLFGGVAALLMECLMAGLLFEQGQLEKAYRHALAANAAIGAGMAPESEFFAAVPLVNVLDALGDAEGAQRQLDTIGRMIDRSGAYYLSRNHSALCARRRLADGDMNTARAWLEGQGEPLAPVSFYDMYATFTTCRAYIALGAYDSAIVPLEKLRQLCGDYNRTLDSIEADILLAIAYWKKRRSFQAQAMACLERAVTLAYPLGFTQAFVSEGPELSGMMLRLQKSVEQRQGGVPVSFIKMLNLKMQESPGSGLTSGQAEPPVKYTQKQKTVMQLLCQGKSYREIAGLMGIKLPTLRSHIALIYKKLDVTCEADAVAKIRAHSLVDLA